MRLSSVFVDIELLVSQKTKKVAKFFIAFFFLKTNIFQSQKTIKSSRLKKQIGFPETP